MSVNNVDDKVKTAFYYSLGRTSFVKQSVNFIWSNWSHISDDLKNEIKDVLQDRLKGYELQEIENYLLLTFTDERIRYEGPLGNIETAGIWNGLYSLISTK